MQNGTTKTKPAAWLPRMFIVLGILLLVQGGLNAAGLGVRVRISNPAPSSSPVPIGTSLRHTVSLRNYSFQIVHVSAEPSCGCTVVDKSSKSIAPFGSQTLAFDLQTVGMKPGTHNKPVTLYFTAGSKNWTEEIPVTFATR